MNNPVATTISTPGRSLWSRLKVPAILLLIGVNVVYLGGNAALDLWQIFGPSVAFSGTVSAHDHIVTRGENADEFNVLTIASNRGELKFDVPEHTFADTAVGQAVSGELDARGLFGHDEALRTLRSADATVFGSSALNRALGQLFTLFVMLVVGSMAVTWIVRRQTRLR